MTHLVALLQWRDSDAIQLVDLEDGAETRHAHAWQEALSHIQVQNGGVGPDHLFVTDDGVAYRSDFDGKNTPITYPAVSFNVWNYREFEGSDLAVLHGYSETLEAERIAFVRPSTGEILREKPAIDTYLGVQLVRSNAVRPNFGVYHGGKVCVLVGPISGEVKLHTYDPVTNTDAIVNLTGANNDMRWPECYYLKQYNNKLLVVPNSVYPSLSTPPTKNYFELDNGLIPLGYYVAGFTTFAAVIGEAAVRSQPSLPATGRYVAYLHNCDRLFGGEIVLFDSVARSLSRIVLPTIPDEQLPVASSLIDIVNTTAKCSVFDQTAVLWVGRYIDVDGRSYQFPALFVIDLATGNLVGKVDYSLDSTMQANQDQLYLFQVQPYEVHGYVRLLIDNTPVAAQTRVCIQDEDSDIVLATGESDATGLYSFRCWTAREKTIMAYHPVTGVRSGRSTLTPEVVN